MAKILRYNAILGWAAEQFGSDSPILAGMFLHSSILHLRFHYKSDEEAICFLGEYSNVACKRLRYFQRTGKGERDSSSSSYVILFRRRLPQNLFPFSTQLSLSLSLSLSRKILTLLSFRIRRKLAVLAGVQSVTVSAFLPAKFRFNCRTASNHEIHDSWATDHTDPMLILPDSF